MWRPPPKGYAWVECPQINSAFLKPHGWHYETFKTRDGHVVRIRKEPPKERMIVGLTLNVVKDCTKKTNVKPTQYCAHYFLEYMKKAEVDYINKPVHQGNLTLFRGEADKILDDKVKYRIVLCGVANDKTDTLQLITYGCPLTQWEKHKSVALPILQNFVANENL
jgi:hypothetical protein